MPPKRVTEIERNGHPLKYDNVPTYCPYSTRARARPAYSAACGFGTGCTIGNRLEFAA